jgi:gliding motility-associated-like protein
MLIGVAPNANYTYVWNTGAATSQVLTDNFTRDYRLTADNNGCKGIDAMHVKVLTACVIKVPNAFTPNNDGLNDRLMATDADLAKNFSLQIFNRAGQQVFSTNNPLEGWDGRFKGNPQDTGTYVWMLSYINPWTGKAVKEKGTSILLR